MNFRDPSDVVKFLTDSETDSDATVNAALKKLAENKPYLVAERRPSGRAQSGGNGSVEGTLSLNDIRNMTQAEIIAKMDDVQKAMAAAGKASRRS